MVHLGEMNSSQPQEVLPRPSSCGAGSWLQRLLSTKNKSDGTEFAVEEVPPTSAHSSDNGGLLQEQFIDIMDPGFREIISEESSYRGQVLPENDKFHGYGHYRCSEYAIVGHWQNGLAHGDCHQVWTDGRAFDGQFQSGSFNGHGRMEWTDGRSFRGQFQGGLFNGHGRMEWQHPHGVMVYEGEYKDDQKHGHGRFSWPSGRCYDGQWVNGQRHGVGDDIGTDGTTLRRVWEDNIAIHTMPMAEEIPLSSSLQSPEDNRSVEENA